MVLIPTVAGGGHRPCVAGISPLKYSPNVLNLSWAKCITVGCAPRTNQQAPLKGIKIMDAPYDKVMLDPAGQLGAFSFMTA